MSLDAYLKKAAFQRQQVNDQTECPLVHRIPAEIRNEIFNYVLTDYEDPNEPYDIDTCYRRPHQHAPRRIDTALLYTCKLVYLATYAKPMELTSHVFYAHWPGRFPPRHTSVASMRRSLRTIHDSRNDNKTLVQENVQFFAQLKDLEPGDWLQNILDLPHFQPRHITITIRHTDWWHWESDAPLQIRGEWVAACAFPDTVRDVKIEFESLERKAGQVDSIAEQAASKWAFRSKSGRRLVGEAKEKTCSRWTGSSTWQGQRWFRDEERTNEIDYYVRTVTWRPNRQTRKGQQEQKASGDWDLIAETNDEPSLPRRRFISEYMLALLGLPREAPAADVAAAFEEWDRMRDMVADDESDD